MPVTQGEKEKEAVRNEETKKTGIQLFKNFEFSNSSEGSKIAFTININV